MLSRRGWLSVAALAAFGLAQASASAVQAAEKDIVTTAVEAGSFKTLAKALQAAGVLDQGLDIVKITNEMIDPSFAKAALSA